MRESEVFVDEAESTRLESCGVATLEAAEYLGVRIRTLLREHARDFVGVQEVGEMLERCESVYPGLAAEVVPSHISKVQLSEVLKRLVDEKVSIRDLKGILEALATLAPHTQDLVQLVESVRAALSKQIVCRFVEHGGRLPVLLLDSHVEDTVASGIVRELGGGSSLALDPSVRRELLDGALRTIERVSGLGVPPILVVSSAIRRYVYVLLKESECRGVSVLSFEELPPELLLQPMGRISLDGASELGPRRAA